MSTYGISAAASVKTRSSEEHGTRAPKPHLSSLTRTTDPSTTFITTGSFHLSHELPKKTDTSTSDTTGSSDGGNGCTYAMNARPFRRNAWNTMPSTGDDIARDPSGTHAPSSKYCLMRLSSQNDGFFE